MPLFSNKKPPTIIAGIRDIAHAYDVFFIDLWGVVYEGKTCFPEAKKCLEFLKENGKHIWFMSNTPHKNIMLQNILEECNIPKSLYHGIHTGGQMAYDYLKGLPPDFLNKWEACYAFDQGEGEHWAKGLRWKVTDDISQSDFILGLSVSPSFDDTEEFEALLYEARKKNIPFLSINSDRIARKNKHLERRVGLLAESYEKHNGSVVWFGKPQKSFYQFIMNQYENKPLRFISIGDTLETDILGASQMGIDSILVLRGTHEPELFSPKSKFMIKKVGQLCEKHNLYSTYACEKFIW